ncbi:MAG: hypothetical protein ACTSRX_10200, partial [Promethearchaeota archaeon]
TAGEADYLHNNHFTGWKQTYSTRSDDTVAHQTYYTTIEDLLQNGIEEIASAIQYICENYNIEGDENKILPAFPISIIIGLSLCTLTVITKKLRNLALRD